MAPGSQFQTDAGSSNLWYEYVTEGEDGTDSTVYYTAVQTGGESELDFYYTMVPPADATYHDLTFTDTDPGIGASEAVFHSKTKGIGRLVAAGDDAPAFETQAAADGGEGSNVWYTFGAGALAPDADIDVGDAAQIYFTASNLRADEETGSNVYGYYYTAVDPATAGSNLAPESIAFSSNLAVAEGTHVVQHALTASSSSNIFLPPPAGLTPSIDAAAEPAEVQRPPVSAAGAEALRRREVLRSRVGVRVARIDEAYPRAAPTSFVVGFIVSYNEHRKYVDVAIKYADIPGYMTPVDEAAVVSDDLNFDERVAVEAAWRLVQDKVYVWQQTLEKKSKTLVGKPWIL